jgi:prepilin-type N-terminal cleavage/methylation domain-containing protein
MRTEFSGGDIKKDSGFSLIEILIALSIFAIGILAVATLQVSALLESRNSADITQASNLASGQLEEIMHLPFLHSELDPASNPHSKSSGKFLIQWLATHTDLNSDGVFESKTVDLTVSWKRLFSPGPDQRQVKIVFIKHDD